eukprot:TRINITY_DN4943_c0_g1_i1.p1 TRINITY_DN4943_c0_g1~~TRINITY_DN4943_c0_g1_i1.p1  ORF type:complete len:396 (+),score=141.82 TRINITY_DN4943_c0_g1_i1:46-1233(+)
MSKIFVANGHPLVFYLAIKQRNKEAELKKLIESGGGKTTPKPRSQAIYITDNADQFKDDDVEVYSTSLIYDSVEKKKLLPMKDYQLNDKEEEEEASEEDLATQTNVKSPKSSPNKGKDTIQTPPASPTKPSPSNSVKPSPAKSPAKSPNKRKEYTPEEDKILLEWIRKHTTKSPNGTSLWDLAEKKKITDHTSQSMRSRYVKVLAKRMADADQDQMDEDDKELVDTLQKMSQEPESNEEEKKPKKAATPKKQQQTKKGGKKRKLQEEEENEEESAQDEQPAKKKRRFSMPYISAAVRKRQVLQFFEDLLAETKVKPVVAVHALIVYSGNINLARQYLLNKGNVDKCEVKPWTPEEDEVLLRKADMIEIQVARGREVTLERIDFLDFLSPDDIWVR